MTFGEILFIDKRTGIFCYQQQIKGFIKSDKLFERLNEGKINELKVKVKIASSNENETCKTICIWTLQFDFAFYHKFIAINDLLHNICFNYTSRN